MIEKMSKCQFLIYHKDYQDFLLKLRELGVVHIVQKQAGVLNEGNQSISQLLEREKRYMAVVKLLNHINEEHKINETEVAIARKDETGIELLESIELLVGEKDSLYLERQTNQKEIERITPWGDFELEKISRFNEKGWYIHFHSVTESRFDPQWIEEYNAIFVGKVSSQCYFITFTKDEMTPPIEAEHVMMPTKSISELQKRQQQIAERCGSIEKELIEVAKNDIETLRYQQLCLKDKINFEKVELSADAAAGEKLMLLEGYVPVKEVEQANKAFEQEAIYYSCEAPKKEDNVPIKFKNNRFARAFEMITDLYDRPNYNAFDLTPFYAPFYVIFFGLCLGDAGYGLLVFIASFLLKRAKSSFMKSAGQLAMYLGIGTMIFGFLSGTFFGIPLADQTWTWIQPFQKVILNSDQLFTLALACGALQITYALVIKAVTTWIRHGLLYALDTIGWLTTLWGNVVVLLLGGRGIITPEIQKTAHIIVTCLGGFMMLFFNNIEKGAKGIPMSIGSGLYGLYNKLSGILGDMLSYIRLFALGISGSVMGLVFNQLAVSFAPDVIILKQLVMIVILLFGHAINIFLNGLGAFIHPMRLTFVEFYNNAGFEGGGKAYSPFKKEAA